MADQAAPIAVDLRGAAPGPAPAPARRVVVRRGRATRRPQEDAAPAQPPPAADDEEAARDAKPSEASPSEVKKSTDTRYTAPWKVFFDDLGGK